MKSLLCCTFSRMAVGSLLLTSAHAATTVTRFDASSTDAPFTSTHTPGVPGHFSPGGTIIIPGTVVTLPDGSTLIGPPTVIVQPVIFIPPTDAQGRIEATGSALFALSADSVAFTTGSDLTYTSGVGSLAYMYYLLPQSGASFTPDPTLNFVGVSLDGDDVYESVAQFFLQAEGPAQLLAIATNDDNTPMSISQGYALIVPEPSGVALTALSLAGLLVRRKR